MAFKAFFLTMLTWMVERWNILQSKIFGPKALPKPLTSNVIPVASAHAVTPLGTVKSDGKTDLLRIESWDPMIEDNGLAHCTSEYEIMNKTTDSQLVARRGLPFYIKFNLNRDYDNQKDGLSLVLTLDGVDKPQHGNGTFVIIPVLNIGEETDGNWHAVLFTKEVHAIVVKVITPVNALVGKWKLDIDVKKKAVPGAITFSTNLPMYIIFNPWCIEDTVFMADEHRRQEYVLQDTGYIYRGTHRKMVPTVWKYGQYRKDILDCALYLLTEIGKIRSSSRSDPVLVSRVLSGVINSDGNDKKVIASKWDNNFANGTSPTHWMGSVSILLQYYKTKKPVKYGQCWVNSGIYTTLCRALGLPCRVVTNYSSARDADGNLTVDYIIDAEGKLLENINGDAIWAFHTWNEVWMQRLDLGKEYDGWQALDSSASKNAEGSTRCGPASVVAIKQGHVRKAYNADLLFGEVNADQIVWKYNNATDPLSLIRKDSTSVGKQIVTKPIGVKEQEEILTENYKYPEESSDERKAMLTAQNKNTWIFSRFSFHRGEFNDIKFNFVIRDNVLVGQPFSVGLVVENINEDKEYKVSVILRVDSVIYTGRSVKPIKYVATDLIMQPKSSTEVKLPLSWLEYGPRLQSQCMFNVACLAKVHGVNYEYFAQDFAQLDKPKISTVTTSNKVTKVFYESLKMEKVSSFINPLPVPLRKGEFIVDAPGISKEFRIPVAKDVQPGEKVQCTYWLKEFNDANMLKSSIKFHCNELDDIEGYHYSAIKAENSANGVNGGQDVNGTN